MEQLVNTFTVSKFDSNCPVYACITPLRLLLKCRQEMAHETLKLQKGSISKDEVDVSGNILKFVHMHIVILRILIIYCLLFNYYFVESHLVIFRQHGTVSCN